MRIKSLDLNWVLLIVALLIGVIAAWATKNYFATREQQLRDELSGNHIQMMDVLVAKMPLNIGDVISEQNMSVRSVPADVMPMTALSPNNFGDVVGRVLVEPMGGGRPLLTSYVQGTGAVHFSDLLEPGQRAVTIDVDAISSNAGMLVPSDRVDVLLQYQEQTDAENSSGTSGSNNQKKLELLLANAKVLATGKRSIDVPDELATQMFDNPTEYNTVTLALSLKDAARVSLAKSKGSLVTLLRNATEDLPIEFQSLYQSEIFAKNLTQQKVEIITGGGQVKTTYQRYPINAVSLNQNANK
ncbi:Flp pilus assembly protein CpaB [Shewanella sp.]|uniref:Flp pilus assembly protein CpaB n=1 Tax=Shewanella sp. TaxID=50422 RepID=UPI003A970A75